VPVHDFSYRLLWPNDTPLYIKNHNTELQPEIRSLRNMKEYFVSLREIPAIVPDSDLPVWYSPYPRIQFSESATWADVAQWGAPLYAVPRKLSPSLRTKIQELKAESDNPEKQLIAALRFVQDEVRYMGIEVGPSSHKPHDPSTVLERRFGDCKDKVLLLRTLLAAMDIEAYPALVHTRYRQTIGEWHPSPYAFNHVILLAKIGGENYWVDPTRSHQRGSLQYLSQPNYGVALVLDEQSTELTTIPFSVPTLPKKEINERFNIPADLDKATTLKIETIFRGISADYMRADLATQSLDELEKSYVNYYASIYPEITVEAPITVNDDQYRNVLIVRESYTIPHFWQASEDEDGIVEAEFYPLELYDLIEEPTTKQRTMPLAVPYPVYYRHTAEVNLPDDWNIDPYSAKIETDTITFEHHANYKNRRLTIDYEYRTKRDHLAPDKAASYIAQLEEVEDEFGYVLSTPRNTAEASIPPAAKTLWYDEINWTVLMPALLIFGIAVVAVLKVYRYAPPILTYPGFLDSSSPAGLKGWLIVVALNVSLQPIRLLGNFPYEAYTKNQWSILTTPGTETYHALWQPILILELAINIFWFVFSILIIVLFFQKRYTFPKIYIVYLLAVLLGQLLDHFASLAIPYVREQANASTGPQLIGYSLGVVIWGLYFSKSRRVKNTFVEILSTQAEITSPLPKAEETQAL
jgi:hypothetical protein